MRMNNLSRPLRPKDLLALRPQTRLPKITLYKLIQLSKIETSPHWGGGSYIIGNTPQQGINWIGKFPKIRAVIIKAITGAYSNDGWTDVHKNTYRYSFKQQKGLIDYDEMANKVLISQIEFGYPVLLFIEEDENWIFHGRFLIQSISISFVELVRAAEDIEKPKGTEAIRGPGKTYSEGERKLVAHYRTERSMAATVAAKAQHDGQCEICSIAYLEVYGTNCIEAHHKIPVAQKNGPSRIAISDLALLCPNCHSAVHAYMRKGLSYADAKSVITEALFRRR